MEFLYGQQAVPLRITSYLVVSFRNTGASNIVKKLRLLGAEVTELLVCDPRELYWINDYEFDVLIVSDGSEGIDFSRAAYKVIRDVAPSTVLVAEGQKFIDSCIISNIYSKYDGFINFDADLKSIDFAIAEAVEKWSFRESNTLYYDGSKLNTKPLGKFYGKIFGLEICDIIFEILIGLMWFIFLFSLAYLMLDWH